MAQLLTVTEFAVAVKRSEQTVWRWMNEGRLESVDDGRRRMLKASDVPKMKAVAQKLRLRAGTKRKPESAVTEPAAAGKG